jgi:hypothetical protein
MAIKSKPKTPESFINAGADSAAAVYEKGVRKGNKRQITLTIAPDLLRKVDEVARRTGQGRAGIINLAIYKALEGEFFK